MGTCCLAMAEDANWGCARLVGAYKISLFWGDLRTGWTHFVPVGSHCEQIDGQVSFCNDDSGMESL